MVKINIFLPVATMATIGSTLAHNLRLRPKDKNEVMLAETDAKKLQYKVPYTRGYPGSPNPFFYDQGDDSDNPDTDWTFIWFWILLVMVASIIAIIITAYATSDVLEEGYAEKRAEEKKEQKEKEEEEKRMEEEKNKNE